MYSYPGNRSCPEGRCQVPYGKDEDSRNTSASFLGVDFRTLNYPWPGTSLQPTQTLHNFNTKCLHPTHADTSGNSSLYDIYDFVSCKQLICWESYFAQSQPRPFPLSCGRQVNLSQSLFHFKSVHHTLILKQTVILNK